MPAIDIKEITIAHERIREDLGNLETLIDSINRFGQLQPIIVDNDLVLLDGFRRYSAIKAMGAATIDAVYVEDVDELLSREIELEANIQRKDMTWQERAKGLAELDRLKRERDPSWNQSMTGAIAGVNQREVSQSVSMARLMEVIPEVKAAKTLNQALNIAKQKLSMGVRKHEVANAPDIYASIEERIILGDSVEVIRSIPDGSFDAIITDPPFGVDYDQRVSGTVGESSSYEDGRESYLRILGMAPDIYRALKPNGWLIWFCGFSWYERVKEVFRGAGFTVDEIPIVWDRSDGRTFTNRPDRYFTKGYDIAIHAFRGEPQLVIRGRSNVIRVPPVGQSERELLVERPVDLYAELINRLTLPGEVVADFFVGSGSCPAAAASLGRSYFGIELNPERRAAAIQKIRAYTP